MIAECADDLYNKIVAITQLSRTTGLVIGGKAPDTGMVKLPLPAAWILPASAVNSTPEPFMRQPRSLLPQMAAFSPAAARN